MKPPINPGSRADIEAARGELMAWLDRQPIPIRDIAGRIVGHLGAAQIGARPNRTVKAQLLEEVTNLERARACLRSAQGR